MRPGPTNIHACPECGFKMKESTILSGNTIDAKLYSDGKRIAPMLPSFPDLTKCKKCKTLFWLSKLEPIEKIDPWGKQKPKYLKMKEAKFPKLKDYFRALEEGLAADEEEELYIRTKIWWKYNDRARKKKEIFLSNQDEINWRTNCERLLELFNPGDYNELIKIAEVKRNLADFEGCLELIKEVDDYDLKWLTDKFKDACANRNRWVIQLY